MRYLPVASVTLLERRGTGAGSAPDYATLPMVQYNAKDDLQRQALRTVGIQLQPPAHTVPSFDGFFSAIHAGLGWGMVTEHQWQQLPDDDSLVRLPDLPDADVALYWQSWTLRSDRLDRLRSAVRSAASAGLHPSA